MREPVRTRSVVLPDDMLLLIVQYCSVHEITRLCMVQRGWWDALTAEPVWQLLASQRAPATQARLPMKTWRETLLTLCLTRRGWDTGSPPSFTATPLRGHTRHITQACVFGTDRCCSVSDDATMRVWDTSAGESLLAVENTRGTPFTSLQLAAQRGHAYCGDAAGFLTTYDMEEGAALLRRYAGACVTTLSRNPLTDLLGAAAGMAVHLWDARIPRLASALTPPHQDSRVSRIHVEVDRVVACTTRHAYVWDLRRGSVPLFQHPADSNSSLTELSCDPMGPRTVLGQTNGMSVVFNTQRGLVERVLPYQGSAVSATSIVSGCVAAGGHDGEVMLAHASGEHRTVYKHAGKVNDVKLQHGCVVAGSSDGSISVCPTEPGAVPFDLRASSLRGNSNTDPHPTRPAVSSVTYNGSRLVATCDNVIRVYTF